MKTGAAPRLTPMLKQYYGVKRDHPDAILFFRMGDFFELFFEDAKLAARALGIALTSRSKEEDMPMAGVPARAVDSYIQKLVALGHTVVVCDQVEDPKDAKGIVRRDVTRIVTPGTLLEDAMLDGTQHNFVAAVAPGADGEDAGLAWLDLSTARFEGRSLPADVLEDELGRLGAAELLVPREHQEASAPWLRASTRPPALTARPDHEFEVDIAQRRLLEHFGVASLRGFGVEDGEPLVAAAGAVLAYAMETQRGALEHVRRLTRRTGGSTMTLDRAAIQALELFETSRDRTREGSLLGVLDRTRTSGGARLLRDWIAEPLIELPAIHERQAAVADFYDAAPRREAVRTELDGIFDLERITARLALRRCSPRDLAQLRDSLARLPALRASLDGVQATRLRTLMERAVAPADLTDLLARALVDAPPAQAKEGGILREGYDEELDSLRSLRGDSKDALAAVQAREIERTGIPSLKIGFNSVFGYYLEVTHTHTSRVPDEYVRKQTLKNAERYITPELKELETRILRADDQALALEQSRFEELRATCAEHVDTLQALARTVATLDALTSLADVAREQGFVRPDVDDSLDFDVDAAFHPVLAKTLGRDAFVPNDCRLCDDPGRFALITGPNMAGKSTFLRQTALVALLAQIGGYVPAARARLGVVDRIFTRVGASDDLVQGASTFMVEMTETATILHHATARSLVVLDEIGRGTGTDDGLALARSLTEHLATKTGCRALFATHYHQLTTLADQVTGVCNLHVLVKEWGEEIIFLHEIAPGGTDRSYGIHVARLAGLPKDVIQRARALLDDAEAQPAPSPAKGSAPSPERDDPSLATLRRLRDRVRTLDPERLTPLQALQELFDLRRVADGAAAQRRRRARSAKAGGDGALFGDGGS